MLITYKNQSPINLANTEYINFKTVENAGIINFRFKHEYYQWKFSDPLEGEKVFKVIEKMYYTEIKIE